MYASVCVYVAIHRTRVYYAVCIMRVRILQFGKERQCRRRLHANLIPRLYLSRGKGSDELGLNPWAWLMLGLHAATAVLYNTSIKSN